MTDESKIELVPLDHNRLEILRGLASTEPLISVLRATADMYALTGQTAPWLSYLTAHEDTGVIIGICSFTGMPDDDGRIEISYFTFPGFENLGVGSRMAAALVEIARSQPEITLITAHTSPEENASTRILQRLGFVQNGTATDPDVGPVWAWELEAGTNT
ncbi:hypothetical protein IZ6_19200 [Terrihabitans soli]|uniref:N-acetyltransferase domain-containing protein n=1 Tax=Terrihabitans soli TaxID=708113 RepID=A0A6S6QUD9_9HYPH|nr:GNAT family N-acetyltransferase [Terrihabitans soli]BCJ91185.1 hypothetical protein IZ6_19200 [Terrihabitans soli]